MIFGPLRVILEPVTELIGRADELFDPFDLLRLDLLRGGRCLVVLSATTCGQESRGEKSADDHKKTQ